MTSKLSTTTRKPQAALLPLITPGEFLNEEFLEPLGISVNALSIALRVPQTRMHGIVKGGRGITADTALRLAQYFGTTPEFWMNVQSGYELDKAKRESMGRIALEVHRRPKAKVVSRHGDSAVVAGNGRV